MHTRGEERGLKKNTFKFFMDVVLFVDMSSVAVLGLLLGFVIPKGGRHSSDIYFLGLHRHEWGDVHLYLALFFLFLLIFHLWLNWAWIIQSAKRYFKGRWKEFLWAVSMAWIVVLTVGWIAARM